MYDILLILLVNQLLVNVNTATLIAELSGLYAFKSRGFTDDSIFRRQ